MKYEKPALEEIDLLLEGSFLETISNGKTEVIDKNEEAYDGDDWG